MGWSEPEKKYFLSHDVPRVILNTFLRRVDVLYKLFSIFLSGVNEKMCTVNTIFSLSFFPASFTSGLITLKYYQVN